MATTGTVNGHTWEATPIVGTDWRFLVTLTGGKARGILEVTVRGDGSLYCDPRPMVRDARGVETYPRTQVGEFRVNGRLVTDVFKLEHRRSGDGFYVDNFWDSLTPAACRTLLPILEDISANLCTPEYAARKELASAENMADIKRSDLLEALKACREARANVNRARANLASIVGDLT